MSPARQPVSPQRQVHNRLNRAHGQLAGVIRAVEAEAPCGEVIQQLAAVSAALQRAGFLIIATAMRRCLDPAIVPETPSNTPEELEKLFMMLA
ncbi:MAG: metal-sensitive transcriptional regulator [Micrococcales bacterium]|nr:metal-sensitive transcriptional regulator [Micrococcales bacterium]